MVNYSGYSRDQGNTLAAVTPLVGEPGPVLQRPPREVRPGAIAVEDEEFKQAETSGGYAKEMSDEYKKKQADLIAATAAKQDIIICTALIPGKKAPRIISEEMVKSMKPGSIIYDLAVSQGGNSAFSESDKVNIINGVKIMGSKNILNNLALTASNLYAKNLYNFVNNLYSKEKKDIYINLEDEIINKTLINKEL